MKKAAVLCLGVAAMLWSGCSSSSTPTGLKDPTRVTVSILNIGLVVIGGASGVVQGYVSADSALSNIQTQVLDGSGADQTANFNIGVTGGYGNLDSVDLKVTMGMTIAAKSTAVAGTYKLVITASSGAITNTAQQSFTVETAVGVPVTVTIGSYQNTTYGSSIDLDSGKVELAAQAEQSGSGVDLVMTYSSDYTAFRVMSPYYAANSSNITAFANWVNPNQTPFAKVNVSFDSVSTKEQIKALFDASQTTTGVLSCSEGDVLVVETDQGQYALVLINSFDPLTTGTATIKFGI